MIEVQCVFKYFHKALKRIGAFSFVMDKNLEQALDSLGDLRDSYIRNIALLVNMQRYDVPMQLLASQEGVVRRSQERLLDAINKKEIVVSNRDLADYLLDTAVKSYRESEVDARKAENSLAQTLPEDIGSTVLFVNPIVMAENYKALVEAVLKNHIGLP